MNKVQSYTSECRHGKTILDQHLRRTHPARFDVEIGIYEVEADPQDSGVDLELIHVLPKLERIFPDMLGFRLKSSRNAELREDSEAYFALEEGPRTKAGRTWTIEYQGRIDGLDRVRLHTRKESLILGVEPGAIFFVAPRGGSRTVGLRVGQKTPGSHESPRLERLPNEREAQKPPVGDGTELLFWLVPLTILTVVAGWLSMRTPLRD